MAPATHSSGHEDVESEELESVGDRLLELLDSVRDDLAVAPEPERPDQVAGASPSASENRAIHTARSVVEQSRAAALLTRVEEARATARRLVAERRARPPAAPSLPSPRVASTSPSADEVMRATLTESARRLNLIRTTATDPTEMLQGIVSGVLVALPGLVGASITMMDRAGVITTHAPSDETIAAIDRVQSELREGPCVDALDDAHPDTTNAPDLSADAPWPRFAAGALESGVQGVLSFRLAANGAAGALNLYVDVPHRLSARDRLLAALFADQAAVALNGARRVGQLNSALLTRDVIGRAKGVLMERFGLDDQHAFQMLVEASQSANIKLSDVAEWLVREAEAKYAAGAHPGG